MLYRPILGTLILIALTVGLTIPTPAQIIVDHNCTTLPLVPASWISQAKTNLHIAYGHTSHGSQVTTGMTGLVSFTGGCGGPQFAWNNGGSSGALDLHDYAMAGDCGYYPQWVNETRTYLNNPANSDVNVIIWSWCGQHSGYTQQNMIDRYLAPMAQLETEYPRVRFVYMTGHLNHSLRTNTNARNQQIRDWCHQYGKVLYDFADIECFDPDGVYYFDADDACNYWNKSGSQVGNWATTWQNNHVQNVEWYSCSSAHSQPLNANRKAYAAWWLWARLSGWSGLTAMNRDRDLISVATGGQVNFTLNAGGAHAGRHYLLAGSFSGTSPGFTLPGNLATLPLNLDGLTYLMVGQANSFLFQNFQGTLDAQGRASATLNLGPMPSTVSGFCIHFAYLLYDGALDFTSNALSVKLEP